MKKMIKKVSAAAMSAALVLGNGVMLSAYATDGEVTTTIAATETTVTSSESTSEAVTSATETSSTTAQTTAEVTTTAASQGFVAGTFYATSPNYEGYNTYNYSSDGKGGSYTNSVTGKTVTFTASYTNGVITLTYSDGTTKTGNVSNITQNVSVTGYTITWNGGEVETFSVNVPAVTTTTTTAAAASTTSSATNAAGSTTAAPTTTKAATTTAKANKNDSPKTGDSFPALAMTAALLTAAGLSFATRKKND